MLRDSHVLRLSSAPTAASNLPSQELAMSDKEPRECWCERCDRAYPVWVTTNPLWNRVIREAGNDEPFLCPTCFALLAEERGVVPTAWVLLPETPDVMERYLLVKADPTGEVP